MIVKKSAFNEYLNLLTDKLKIEEKEEPTYSWTISQLRHIFDKTENAWVKNLKNYKSEIKYLLICEAPPWSMTNPKYFYLQPQGQLFDTVWKTFFNSQKRNTPYKCLAKVGFLLIDSLPFSINYKTKHRKSDDYFKLIKACLPWWINKLNNSGLTFSKDMEIALGYYWNGKQVINASGGNLTIYDNKYNIYSCKIISHKGSRYLPDEKQLKEVFKITKPFNCP